MGPSPAYQCSVFSVNALENHRQDGAVVVTSSAPSDALDDSAVTLRLQRLRHRLLTESGAVLHLETGGLGLEVDVDVLDAIEAGDPGLQGLRRRPRTRAVPRTLHEGRRIGMALPSDLRSAEEPQRRLHLRLAWADAREP